MRASLPLSIVLHGAAVGALLSGWIPKVDRDLYVPPIPIEVIREAELAELLSVPELVKAPDPEVTPDPDPVVPEPVPEPAPEPAPQMPPEPAPEPEPDPEPAPVVEPVPTPEPPTPDPKPEPPKPEPPKPEPPKPAQDDELDLGALADTLVDLDPDKRTAAPTVVREGAMAADRNQAQIGSGATLTIREEDLFRARMYECWNPDMGVPDASDLVVEVKIFLNLDGTLAGAPQVLNNGRINRSGNSYWTAARTRALSAVQRCAPYSFLDPARYDQWRTVTFNFDPDER